MRLEKAPKKARNLPCSCGSGIKYKKCCFKKEFINNFLKVKK